MNQNERQLLNQRGQAMSKVTTLMKCATPSCGNGVDTGKPEIYCPDCLNRQRENDPESQP